MAIVLELIDAEIEAFHSNVETGSVDDKSPTRSSTPDKSREMYGPPQDCKGKFGREDKSAQMYSSIRAKMLSRTKISARCLQQRSESELRDQSPSDPFVESSWVERSPPTINSVTTATMIAYSDTQSRY